MNLTLRHVVPALAGAIATRKSCFATSKCCRLKAGLQTGRFMERTEERGASNQAPPRPSAPPVSEEREQRLSSASCMRFENVETMVTACVNLPSRISERFRLLNITSLFFAGHVRVDLSERLQPGDAGVKDQFEVWRFDFPGKGEHPVVLISSSALVCIESTKETS